MVTVVKHGCTYPNTYETKCPSCKCIFNFDKEDIKVTRAFVAPIPVILCPECQHICVVKEKYIWPARR